MTILQALLSFVAAATLLTVTPGVDTAIVLRTAASSGPKPAALAGAGILLGCLIWAAIVSVGLGALLAASEIAFTALRWAGAGYLLYLGLKLVARPRTDAAFGETRAFDSTPAQSLRQGLLTNLLNPKVGVFYLTFLPQFIPANVNAALFAFLLALIHALLGALWFAVIIAAAVPMGRTLRKPAVIRALDRITGGVFIVFGLKLALTR